MAEVGNELVKPSSPQEQVTRQSSHTLDEEVPVEVPPPMGLTRALVITMACTLAMVNNASASVYISHNYFDKLTTTFLGNVRRLNLYCVARYWGGPRHFSIRASMACIVLRTYFCELSINRPLLLFLTGFFRGVSYYCSVDLRIFSGVKRCSWLERYGLWHGLWGAASHPTR
jgi:hypothetical protein